MALLVLACWHGGLDDASLIGGVLLVGADAVAWRDGGCVLDGVLDGEEGADDDW